jgi:hypothetical protein
MIKKGKIILVCFAFLMVFVPGDAFAQIYGRKLYRDFVFGYDFSRVLDVRLFVGRKFGFWGGIKIPLTRPEGEKRFFSQEYTDKWMDNEFTGYSRELFYGAGGGLSISFFHQQGTAYIGIGGLQAIKYRQYLIELYEDHSFMWRKHYYIEDGKISEIRLDIMTGLYFRYKMILFGIGYSSGTSNVILHAGASFD